MNPSTQHTRTALGALILLHLSRLRRPVIAMLTAMAVLIGIEILKHGVRVDAIMAWILGGTLIMPLAPPLTMVREKADGSLRYLSSLPVSGTQHATARLLVAAAVSLLPAVLAALAIHNMMIASLPVFSLAAFVGVWLMLTVMSLALLAVQLKAPIGQAATYVIYSVAGIMVLEKGVEAAHQRGWLDGLISFAATRAGIVSGSALLWVIVGVVGWASFRGIVRTSVSYRGEPAEA